MMNHRLFQIWFSLRCGVANREFVPVLEQYGSPYDIFNADEEELERLPCSDRLKRALSDKSLQESYRILDYCTHHQVGILFFQDADYPTGLRSLRDAPVLLYYRGRLPDFARLLCVSVVGTRKMSEYGKRMAYKIGYELGAARAVTISGMALGIDGVTAAATIAGGGKTAAVLGCGIDVVYPREHAHLMDAIIGNGVVMTEFPPSTPPEGRNFPIRNRLISGLGQATVVIEANLKSGALITAENAILQGRDIYAVPGNVGDENTSGTNRLIRDGAAVVLRARDILENYTFLYRDVVDMSRLTRAETLSDPDDDMLARFGVYTRTVSPGKGTDGNARRPSPETPSGQAGHRSDRRGSEAGRTTNRPARPTAPPEQKRPPEEKIRSRRNQENPVVPPTADKAESPVTSPTADTGDTSAETVASLTDVQRGIFAALPLDRAVPVDYLTREGYAMGDIMASMTILEIKGLVVSLPGGLYSRK